LTTEGLDFILNYQLLHLQLLFIEGVPPVATQPDRRQTSFGYRFAMLHRLQVCLYKKEILDAGVQPSQLPFLITLVQEEGPVTQDYLSRSLVIDKGTTARAINQLKSAGFVTRDTNPENRRQKLVTATPKAHTVAEKVFSILDNVTEIFVQGFTPEERNLILKLMDRMILNAQEERNGCSKQPG
jgi:DNA-binding MarR family transcriptional regulator